MASRGSIGGVPFTNAEVNSGDLREGVLRRGQNRDRRGTRDPHAPGHATRAVIRALFPDLTGAGPVKAEIALVLPIKNFDRRVVTVMANLDGVRSANGSSRTN